jgi:hypothetical protein
MDFNILEITGMGNQEIKHYRGVVKINIKPIKTQEDYDTTLSKIESLFLDYKTSCA